jgi:acyl-CoA synthetase (AMP-forming)/AMP-acid ligase II/alkylation response protein AidB-like acyl-CoA dehydrogenase/acyl carrier protein
MGREKIITERLQAHADSVPHRTAYTFLRDDGKVDEITFGELDAQARALAAALLEKLAPGERALLLYPSGLEFIRAFFACLYAGVIAIPATMPHKSRPSLRLKALLQDAEPALVLTRSDCEPTVKAGLALVDSGNRSCLATDSLRPAGSNAALPRLSSDAIAFLQYTSGSTALPKGVAVTHKNIMSNVGAIQEAFGFSGTSVMVSWLPLFHDMGLIGSVVSPLYAGFRSILMSPGTFLRNPFLWLNAISRYRGTCAGSPNFGWEYCTKKISDEQKRQLDLGCLEVVYNGSEPVRAETLRNFHQAFAGCGIREKTLFPCYGMAETTLFVSGGPLARPPAVLTVSKALLEGNQIREVMPGGDDAREIVGSGRVHKDTTVMIVDPETHLPCAAHRIGEVWIAGASVTKGYWNRPDETKEIFGAQLSTGSKDTFLRTGDLGFLRDGELFITGRLKDLIIINGRNLYPQDVEELIERSIDFIEPNMCAAFSVEIDNQERLAIVAEANRSLVRAARREQKEQSGKAEKNHAKSEYLASIEAVAHNICDIIAQQFDVSVSSIVFVKPGTFPRTTSGKVQRLRCREMALHGRLDVVYVMPGSIFDRRGPMDFGLPGAMPFAVPLRTVPSRTASVSVADAEITPAIAAGAAESRATADSMNVWFRSYAERRLNSRLIDERRTVPPYVVLDLGNQGFFGLQVPKRFGGSALTTSDMMRVLEQLAAVDLSLATLVGVHNGLGVRPILKFGADAVQGRLLPVLATGRQLAAFALTEPGAGSNPLAMRATAVKTQGGWLVNAEKQWIGLGSWAGILTVFAKAVDPDGGVQGTIALTIPEDTPGLTQGPEALTMGMRGIVQNMICLKDAYVPDDAVLLKPGEGMVVGRDAMMFSRLGIGAMCVGAMKRCAQLMARYAVNRSISTGRLADNPVTIARLHDIASAIFVTQSLVYEIAAMTDQDEDIPAEAYIACKTAASELLGEAADQLVQLLGGRGYTESNIAPQIFRDARVLRILEGPSETLYMHLGASVMRQNCAVTGFISETLRCPQVTKEFLDAVDQIRAASTESSPLFSTVEALNQWLEFRAGQLAAAAIMLAAAEKKRFDAVGLQEEAGRAVTWARGRFNGLRQSILSQFNDRPGFAPAADILKHIGRYAETIGNVEQNIAGEDNEIDLLLRHGSPAAKDTEHEHRKSSLQGFPKMAPAFFTESAAPTSRASLNPSSQPDEANTPQHADTGGVDRDRLHVLETGSAVAGPTRKIVHDSVLKWLLAEKRRAVSNVDYDTPFTSLGMDSLGTATLVLELEQQIGVSINPELFYEYRTINELALHIDGNLLRQKE